MLSFKFKQYVPPGGKYFYEIPDTKIYFEDYGSFQALIRKVEGYYQANKLEIPGNLRALIEHYICVAVAPGFCIGDDPRGPNPPEPLTYFKVTTLTEQFFRGRHRALVQVKEAKDRAGGCMQCPENSLGMCTSCNNLRGLARSFVGGRKLNQDNFLGVCKVFRVPLNALVHIVMGPNDIDGKELPSNCWAKGAVSA